MTTAPQPNTYVHVEIVTKDPEAATKFYESAFNWKIQRFGADMNHYIMYETPSGVSGGIRKPEQGEQPGVLTYVLVKNLDGEIKRLGGLGAKPLAPVQEVPGMGRMVVLAIPGGTIQALWEAAPGR